MAVSELLHYVLYGGKYIIVIITDDTTKIRDKLGQAFHVSFGPVTDKLSGLIRA